MKTTINKPVIFLSIITILFLNQKINHFTIVHKLTINEAQTWHLLDEDSIKLYQIWFKLNLSHCWEVFENFISHTVFGIFVDVCGILILWKWSI